MSRYSPKVVAEHITCVCLDGLRIVEIDYFNDNSPWVKWSELGNISVEEVQLILNKVKEVTDEHAKTHPIIDKTEYYKQKNAEQREALCQETLSI